MTPQLYLELDSNIEIARLEEWIGREYARSISASAYPVPPDNWIGPPVEPPPEAFTWFYSRAVPYGANISGGVYLLYDDVVAFATQAQTLSDGESYSLDIVANAKTYEQLSAAAQAVMPPPEEEE